MSHNRKTCPECQFETNMDEVHILGENHTRSCSQHGRKEARPSISDTFEGDNSSMKKTFEEEYGADSEWLIPLYTNEVSIEDKKTAVRTLIQATRADERKKMVEVVKGIVKSPAYTNLKERQGQVDEDGVCVIVSRQALDETFQALEDVLAKISQV